MLLRHHAGVNCPAASLLLALLSLFRCAPGAAARLALVLASQNGGCLTPSVLLSAQAPAYRTDPRPPPNLNLNLSKPQPGHGHSNFVTLGTTCGSPNNVFTIPRKDLSSIVTGNKSNPGGMHKNAEYILLNRTGVPSARILLEWTDGRTKFTEIKTAADSGAKNIETASLPGTDWPVTMACKMDGNHESPLSSTRKWANHRCLGLEHTTRHGRRWGRRNTMASQGYSLPSDSLGTAKAVSAQKGSAQYVSTTFEWIGGTVIFLILFIVSPYDSGAPSPRYLSWLFEPDCMDVIRFFLASFSIPCPDYQSQELIPNPELKSFYCLGLYESSSVNLWPSFFSEDRRRGVYSFSVSTLYTAGIALSVIWSIYWTRFLGHAWQNLAFAYTEPDVDHPFIDKAYNMADRDFSRGAWLDFLCTPSVVL
ncbi:hypothetical protein GALMADRAFT_215064 [Galerina marginata CBS 339.88]|uniref:Uncharacterized protein n=1 Tax=Galerina marginata (strain CBS 339.88) TaxID=685588 RepID=A0A067SI59_GALM3|nr:hypothetical protein GALMADRAFT_215064 [Galerina marginata CBS 339.88]